MTKLVSDCPRCHANKAAETLSSRLNRCKILDKLTCVNDLLPGNDLPSVDETYYRHNISALYGVLSYWSASEEKPDAQAFLTLIVEISEQGTMRKIEQLCNA
ncbi:MAG: hypothetical protein K6T94_05015 [Paenibacillus sp.]|nr:hypothetical protein [Paenibacillus sp.]